jgi:hypothetical protein
VKICDRRCGFRHKEKVRAAALLRIVAIDEACSGGCDRRINHLYHFREGTTNA